MLLDLGLPERDGLEVLRRLRGSGNRIAVIVITARDGVDDRIRGLDVGADDYLVKPFDVQELLARLRAVARRQGEQAAPMLTIGEGSGLGLPIARKAAVSLGGRVLSLKQSWSSSGAWSMSLSFMRCLASLPDDVTSAISFLNVRRCL